MAVILKLNVNLSSLDQMNIHIALKNLTLNLRFKKKESEPLITEIN